jgi:CheY-like chemotaxis protein
VLVAEDGRVNRKVAADILEACGCRVDLVANGREAVAAVAAGTYAAVFMDCQMPELDGIAATAAIRTREGSARHVPIIAMTASASPADRVKCLAAGMDDYLPKPITRQSVSQVLQRWLAPSAPSPRDASALARAD